MFSFLLFYLKIKVEYLFAQNRMCWAYLPWHIIIGDERNGFAAIQIISVPRVEFCCVLLIHSQTDVRVWLDSNSMLTSSWGVVESLFEEVYWLPVLVFLFSSPYLKERFVSGWQGISFRCASEFPLISLLTKNKLQNEGMRWQ